MTRRREKWCVPGYQVSQRGQFSSSVALTPQFKNEVATHLGQAFRSSLARRSRNATSALLPASLAADSVFEIGTVDLDPKLFSHLHNGGRPMGAGPNYAKISKARAGRRTVASQSPPRCLPAPSVAWRWR